jgi:hypothetical protein
MCPVLLLPSLTFALLFLLPLPVSLLLTVGADMCCPLPSSCLSRLIAMLCLNLPPSFVLVCCTYSHCLTFICHSPSVVLLELLLPCRCRSCYDERWAALHKQACKLLAAPPPPGGGLLLTSCCAFAACTCFQVTPCMLRSLSACLLDLERFSYGRGRSRSLLPCPAMSTLTSCLACTVRLQHACVRPCTLQIVPSQHHNYLHCPACMSS